MDNGTGFNFSFSVTEIAFSESKCCPSCTTLIFPMIPYLVEETTYRKQLFFQLPRIPSVSAAVLERSGPIPQNAPISGAPSALVMDTNISQFCEYTGLVSELELDFYSLSSLRTEICLLSCWCGIGALVWSWMHRMLDWTYTRMSTQITRWI